MSSEPEPATPHLPSPTAQKPSSAACPATPELRSWGAPLPFLCSAAALPLEAGQREAPARGGHAPERIGHLGSSLSRWVREMPGSPLRGARDAQLEEAALPLGHGGCCGSRGRGAISSTCSPLVPFRRRRLRITLHRSGSR
ncbi:hypothetical protein PVAP13_6NG190206 [Panicum virgatum]|uniref:Uncharacterized protein n=1 Tax=Panicum virgatum TaxID=38727 RepID=A0A8T0QYQ9_PANVG|nr:hypothetical protein PVAP13_6NG190206 [Panicum virgatum]